MSVSHVRTGRSRCQHCPHAHTYISTSLQITALPSYTGTTQHKNAGSITVTGTPLCIHRTTASVKAYPG
eukprot:3508160-Rhodomonas_salina.1